MTLSSVNGIATSSATTGQRMSSVFPEEESDPLRHWEAHRLRGSGRVIAGELMVSAETALRETQLRAASVNDELLLYCVHGWLHLCGYDDLTGAERPLMPAHSGTF